MAEVFNLGNVLAQAEGIKGTRTQNALAEQQLSAQNMLMEQRKLGNPLLQNYLSNPTPQNLNALAQVSPEMAQQAQGMVSGQQGIQDSQFQMDQREAMVVYKGAMAAIKSANTKAFVPHAYPEFVKELEGQGVVWDDLTEAQADQMVKGIAERVAPIAGVKASLKEAVDAQGNPVFMRVGEDGQAMGTVQGFSPKPDSPLVQVNTGDNAAGKGFEELEKGAGNEIAAISQQSGIALTNLNTVRQIQRNLDLMGAEGFETGVFAKIAQQFGNAALSLGAGAEFADAIAASEDMEGLSTKLQFAETQILKGAISEKEQDMAGRINTKLNKTMLGNHMAAKRLEAISYAQIMLDEKVGELRESNPKWSPSKILREAKRQMRQLPYVSAKWSDGKGLPDFYPTFYYQIKGGNPDASDDEILSAWKEVRQ